MATVKLSSSKGLTSGTMKLLVIVVVCLGVGLCLSKNNGVSASPSKSSAEKKQQQTETQQQDSLRKAESLDSEHGKGRTYIFDVAGLTGEETNGQVVIEVHPEWAPLGAKQFDKLVVEGFYKDTRFFRVVPDFIVQFGIQGTPGKFPDDPPIKDDPVKMTNKRGTVTFATAGPNTRTTQLFINTNKAGNKFLDRQGFSPFAEVISGMEYIDAIYSKYGEEPDQGKIETKGNAYLQKSFPLLSYIANTKSLEDGDANEEQDGAP